MPDRDPGRRAVILNVDDDDAMRYAKGRLLARAGYEVIEASTGTDALRLCEERSPDLVLLDVKLPDIDGFEVCRRIKRSDPTVLVLQVSATFTGSGDRVRSLDGGADSYLVQPSEPEELLAAVRALLRLRIAEAALRISESRLSLAQQAGNIGVWDWNILTGDIAWSPAQWRLFGIEPFAGGPLYDTWRMSIHPDDRDRAQAAVISTLASPGEQFDTEFRIVRPDGAVRWLMAKGEVKRSAQGQAVRMIGVNMDTTARKDTEAELERLVVERTREREEAIVKLHESQKLEVLGQISGGVAHDFNNLLTTVLGSLDLLRGVLPDDARAQRLLATAIQGAQRGAALTQRMLAFARRQDLQPEAVDLAKLIAGMEDLLRRSLGPGVQVETDFPSGLRPARVDANQLELALLNLAVNARDAMPLGGRLRLLARLEAIEAGNMNRTVTSDPVRRLAPGDYIRIAVIDTGVGMDEATLNRATEPFFTTKGPGKGTGLGLSMVHGLAAQSGGAMRLTSRRGAGTTVELWLPVSDVAASTETAPQRVHEPSPGVACRILLVDDDELIRMSTSALLEDLGHVVKEANSATRALELLHGGEIVDLVITDHAMPGRTGAELYMEIHAIWPALPVILASGYADLPSGMEAVPRLHKPFMRNELATAIAPFVGSEPTPSNVVPFGPSQRQN